MSVTEAQVLDALRAVKDPDLHKDIVALNFVKDVEIAGERVNFTIELTTPACPVREQMKQQAETAVRALPGVREAQANMTSRVTGSYVPQREGIPGVRNVIAVGSGKGGVGKTTLAAAIAVALVRRGHPVHLTTTDPAAHVTTAVREPMPGLRVSRIDPRAETRAYTEEVLATAGRALDAQGRALLEEELRSPCTEEIAVFRAFARVVDEGAGGFVVLDTAPTGHTLLLLDAAEAYHREVSRSMSDLPEAVRQLLPRLRDPAYTRVLVVTLPESTPVHEAAQLQRDLERAGITPFAWIVNQSLTPLVVRDPVLAARRRQEAARIREVREKHATRLALVPWLAGEVDAAIGSLI